jgi:hypothetical protein
VSDSAKCAPSLVSCKTACVVFPANLPRDYRWRHNDLETPALQCDYMYRA